MVVMIGYVKEIRLMNQFAVATLEDFLKVSLIIILFDVGSAWLMEHLLPVYLGGIMTLELQQSKLYNLQYSF